MLINQMTQRQTEKERERVVVTVKNDRYFLDEGNLQSSLSLLSFAFVCEAKTQSAKGVRQKIISHIV